MRLAYELGQLNSGAGVPVSVDEGKPWIRLYAQRACAGVRASRRGDAFTIEFIEPMRLSNHGRLARSRLRVVAPGGWAYFPELRLVQTGYAAPDREIRSAWQRVHAPQPRPAASPARYGEFCDALDRVIDGARQIEAERDPGQRILPYYEVLAAARPRGSSAGVYLFRLSRPGAVQQGSMVHLKEEPDLRGRVTAIDGELLTVTFEGSIDRRRIPEEGDLVAVANDVVQRVQANAVARLREGSTLNPSLMPLLVDRTFAALRAPAADPAEPLDRDQTEAFRRALAVPDLLCVLGPPGTGKTRTIVEIARAAAARGERVVIASQTNTAVDNVIERLPDAMIAIRVGNEDRIAAAVRHKTVAAIAVGLQQRILTRTEATAQGLEPFGGEPSHAGAWLNGLERALAGVESANGRHARALADRADAAAVVEARCGAPAREAERAWQAAAQEAASLEAEVRRLTMRLQRLQTRVGLFGFIHRWRAGRCRDGLAATGPRASRAQALAEAGQLAYEALRTDLSRQVESDPGVRRAAGRAAEAQAEAERQLDLAKPAAVELGHLMSAAGQAVSPAMDAAGLARFAKWCRAWEPFLRERGRLLAEWRERLSRPSEQLHPELIRYADVIGATCIGVGVQRNLLSDLDFDLAVIDEAGQIPLASTLVPLVRARRAVLVGDHRQLPPFVDDDVQHWLRRHESSRQGIDPSVLIELLTRSAFERLLREAPPANQILLSRQRRMPAVLADFVSTAFYGGRLTTETKPRPPSPIFRSPLAVVDTSMLPEGERAERSRRRTETWQVAGCDNRAEARVALDLAKWYAAEGRDWVVIAPYRAQVQLVDLWLREALGAEAIRDRVGTVDAFQGQERDVVMYSFTRSNSGGRVGFLSELRRLNVAITRAREQLILIGDRGTLTNARDEGFRHLAGDLFRYADEHGDVVAASRLRDRIPR
ncbi:AAA domain-containing protein [Actinoplanes sp. NPDC026623]|uniref:DEAD/DEAH box helicase n=1 Tax=Actinoplanes sp. NPDC026623 TaxID=3155610 RepID=UPI00340F0D0D